VIRVNKRRAAATPVSTPSPTHSPTHTPSPTNHPEKTKRKKHSTSFSSLTHSTPNIPYSNTPVELKVQVHLGPQPYIGYDDERPLFKISLSPGSITTGQSDIILITNNHEAPLQPLSCSSTPFNGSNSYTDAELETICRDLNLEI